MKSMLRTTVIAIIATLTMSMTANAQQAGDMAVGANAVFGTGNSFSNFGIGAKFQYNVMDPLRLEGSFTYFFKKNFLSMWDASVNAHWLFSISDKITIYPLAGLSMLGTTVSYDLDLGPFGGYADSASATEFGFNLGGGIDVPVSDKFIINGELKYKICGGGWSRLLISAGVAYRF